jgi:hypothetical protein
MEIMGESSGSHSHVHMLLSEDGSEGPCWGEQGQHLGAVARARQDGGGATVVVRLLETWETRRAGQRWKSGQRLTGEGSAHSS